MKTQVNAQSPKNQENDFIHLAVSTVVSAVFFLGIFVVLTAVSLLG